MKPTKNLVFCLSCQHRKMLFESQKKANRFIEFNGNAILEETGRAPVRSYYCRFCCGWHVTSNPSQEDAQRLDIRDQKKAERLEKWLKDKNVATEIKQHDAAVLAGQLDEVRALLLSFAVPRAEWLLEKTLTKLRFVMKFYPRWHAGLKMTQRGHALQSVIQVLHLVCDEPERISEVVPACAETNKKMNDNQYYIELCKSLPRQKQLKAMKEASLEELKAKLKDDEMAEKVFVALQRSNEGYMIIRREKPEDGETQQGWTYVFAEGLPLHLDTPEAWYSTSNIVWINWDALMFGTQNSVYSFELFGNE